jgi:hypothetical protein
VELCGSVCSLIDVLSGTFSDADHTAYIAEHWVGVLEESIARLDGFRSANPSREILDVRYDDMVASPLDTVERIYGSPLSPAARAAMAAFVDANPKGRRGAHSYELADYGLRRDEIRERFAAYVDRYDVPTRD